MTAVATWGGDAMPDGVIIVPAEESSYYCTRQRAEEIDANLRDAAGEMARGATRAVPWMAEARRVHSWEALGWPSWHVYVEDVFRDLRDLRLNGSPEAVTERRALVAAMSADGMSVRKIQRKLDYSLGTVHSDRRALGLVKAGDVVELPEPEPEVDRFAGMSCPERALVLIRDQGDRGLTCAELELETGWKHQTASPTLRRLERRGLVRRDGRIRHSFGVYVVTEGRP